MSKFAYESGKHAASRKKGRATQGFGVFKFDGEMLSRKQIAERVEQSESWVSTTISRLRKQGVREFKREHFE